MLSHYNNLDSRLLSSSLSDEVARGLRVEDGNDTEIDVYCLLFPGF